MQTTHFHCRPVRQHSTEETDKVSLELFLLSNSTCYPYRKLLKAKRGKTLVYACIENVVNLLE